MTITISRSRARMLVRALRVFASLKPEDLASVYFAPEVCLEAIQTASGEAFSLKLALEREG